MKNSKGQALVEFVIILPIILILIISVIDFGNIISKRYILENDIDTVSEMYKLDDLDKINKYVSDKNITVNYETSDEFITINLSKKIKVTSPILNLILGNYYTAEATKTVYKGEHE